MWAGGGERGRGRESGCRSGRTVGRVSAGAIAFPCKRASTSLHIPKIHFTLQIRY
jgi:hypothetical protein